MFEAYNYLGHLLRTNDKVFKRFKWIANAFVFTGALAIAFSTEFAQQAWPFAINLIGTMMWLKASQIVEDRALGWFQGFFVFINLYAITLRTIN